MGSDDLNLAGRCGFEEHDKLTSFLLAPKDAVINQFGQELYHLLIPFPFSILQKLTSRQTKQELFSFGQLHGGCGVEVIMPIIKIMDLFQDYRVGL